MQIKLRHEWDQSDLDAIHRFRAAVFKERMGWDVSVVDGMEVDDYDALNPYYIVIHGQDNQISAFCRLLPTTGLYMLKNTFPELLGGQPALMSASVWEASRFAAKTSRINKGQFGFNSEAMQLMRGLFYFANKKGVSYYVLATTTAFERIMRHTGLDIERLSAPVRIGIENSVAIKYRMSDKTHDALFKVAKPPDWKASNALHVASQSLNTGLIPEASPSPQATQAVC